MLEVGAVRYEMLEALQSWRLTMDGEVQARPCVRGETATHPVPVALDVRFDAITPAIGTDGQPSGGPKSAEAAAAAGTVGKGHLEQAGRWTGSLDVDGVRHEWLGRARQPRPLLGPAALGRPEDVALVLHQRRRRHALRGHPARHRRRRPAPGLGLGRRPGHLGGRVAGAHRAGRRRGDAPVVHLDVVDKEGRTYPLRGDVLRVADIGRAGGTMVNEGLARWTYEDPDGATAHRLRHLRVPAPARRRREACRPRRVGEAR